MTLAPGMRLGPYEIVAPLGAGGMGEVYRARDPRLGREVAIKVLPAGLALDPERLARLEREAKTVAGLNHPNIVTLHSMEGADGVRFLTMELVEGQSLDRLVTPGGLSLARVLDLAIPLADALVAAHGRGVVHRDLKPANVMVTRDGRVKVLDFGLAKLATSEPGMEETQAATVAAPVSAVGQVVGTVPYMAPEQIRGETVDARTDLFALGIMLYELVTGRRPFAGATTADVSSSILRDTPVPVLTVRAELPPDLGRVIGRCLEKDPDLRIQTAKDVRNELELVRRAEGPAASQASGAAPAPVAPPAQESPSIAVLAFANRSRDADDEYFADGLADELLNVLVKIRGLRVAARTSSFSFKGKEASIADIGRALSVATVLEGSIRKSGNRVRISVQLVKVADGFHLWSETYDRTMDDIFAVQDDIAQAVVKELRTTLLGAEPDSKASGELRAEVAEAAKGRGTNAEAHRLFLQGRFLVNRVAEQDMATGIGYLKQAIEADPAHALAWSCLSWAQALQTLAGFAPVDEGMARARESALKALALEPALAEAHLALGWVQHWYDWDWTGAEASFRRALELAPGNAEILRAASLMNMCLGRLDETLALCRRAIEQDPLNVNSYASFGRACRSLGRAAEAEGAFRKALEISPHAVPFRMLLAWAIDTQGRGDEAIAEAKNEPADWARRFGLATLNLTAARAPESEQALRELIDLHGGHAAYQVAVAYAARGQADAAFEWLEKAYAQRDSGMAMMKPDPLLRPLHSDPRWAAFLRKMGLPE